jgi:hypothetical protein
LTSGRGVLLLDGLSPDQRRTRITMRSGVQHDLEMTNATLRARLVSLLAGMLPTDREIQQ